MSLPHEDARRIVEAWRDLGDSNRTARTYVALIDAMPEDDAENYTAAVLALAAGVPRQLDELRRIVEAAGAVLDEHFTKRQPPARGPDPVDFLGDSDASG